MVLYGPRLNLFIQPRTSVQLSPIAIFGNDQTEMSKSLYQTDIVYKNPRIQLTGCLNADNFSCYCCILMALQNFHVCSIGCFLDLQCNAALPQSNLLAIIQLSSIKIFHTKS